MSQKKATSSLRLVEENSPDSLGLGLEIRKALLKAESRELSILQHENMETLKEVKPVIRARFLIPLAIQEAIGNKKKYAPFWGISQKDVDFNKFSETGVNSPESWLKGDSKVLYEMCASDNVPIHVFMDMNNLGNFALLVIDIDALKSIYQK